MFVPVPLAMRSNQARDSAISSARLVNCWTDDLGSDSKVRNPVMACDGFTSYATLTTAAAHQGMFAHSSSNLYVCNGSAIYRVTSVPAVTSLASGLSITGYAYFAANANSQIVMTTSDGVTRMITAPSTVSTPSFDAEIGASLFNSVCEIDNYFVWTKSDGEFYVSDINNVTTDPLSFARGASRGLSRGVRRGRDIMLSGQYETSFWQNTGQADFAFQRVHLATFGVYAAPAMVPLVGIIDGTATDTVIWPATGPTGDYIGIATLAGYDAKIISTGEVDRAIKAEPTLSSIRAFGYTTHGNTFYCITGSSFTYEYNTRTGLWHQRVGYGLSIGPLVDAVDFGGSVILAPQSTSDALYRLSSSLTPGSASAVTLRTSKNNGTTWTTARSKTIGATGERTTRAVFNRLGQAKEDGLQVEVKITNAVVEGANAVDMTIVPSALHTWPTRTTFDALYVDFVPGASLTSIPKAALQLGVDMRKDAA